MLFASVDVSLTTAVVGSLACVIVGIRAMSNVPLVTLAASWSVGVLASDRRESFPIQTVLELVPVGIRPMSNVPEVTKDAACATGVLASERRASLPMHTSLDVVPVGSLAISKVPLVIIEAGELVEAFPASEVVIVV